MKSHAIIPLFIPHEGCPHFCVFCNQNSITANDAPVTANEVSGIIETHLATLKGRGLSTIEVAFYGGSFTGLPMERQSEFLEIARFYKKRGSVDKIRLSTRPDCIDDDTLSNLERYVVDAIELGAQSFDDGVLEKSCRGHDSNAICESSRMILERGFELGLQLMSGLPGDSPEKSLRSARELAGLRPQTARLYPTVVLDGTALSEMRESGEYTPPSLRESIDTIKDMHRIISGAGITVMRVGLKNAGPHPAFRQLVESEIARDEMEAALDTGKPSARFLSNGKSFSNLVGHCKSNKEHFRRKHPQIEFSYGIDESLPDGRYIVRQ